MTSDSHKASDPARSVWVAANAGSGKTKVLTDRVLRLLLGGTPPPRILCITYTNAATAEMKNRIHEQLAKWVAYDDAELKDALTKLTASPPTAKELSRARSLLATVVESPEGVRIQTIHALCQSLLRRFPVEAGVPPHFNIIDEDASRLLIEEARRQLLISNHPERPELGDALRTLARSMSESSFDEMLAQIVANRRKLQMVLQPEHGVRNALDAMLGEMSRQYGLNDLPSLDEWTQRFVSYEPDDVVQLRCIIPILEGGKPTDKDTAEVLASWWSASAQERIALLDTYIARFVVKDKQGNLKERDKIITKDIEDDHSAMADTVYREQDRVLAAQKLRKSIGVADFTRRLLAVADAMLHSYDELKKRSSSLDFEDQILLTLKLLNRKAVSGWILYKLDGGLDHMLIDEAQDTSPKQWELLTKLVEEFFSGQGARTANRTVFVVGDEKQSIFSFQGAEPRKFGEWQNWFARRHAASEKQYERLPLHVSYRSTESVLQAVDAVFADPMVREGVTFTEGKVEHIAHRSGQAGKVECWELIPAPEKEEVASWQAAAEIIRKPRPETLLAQRIAATIRAWLDEGRMLTAKGRPVRPGDIMLLVRSRSRIVYALLRALRRENIPVAGSDRLKLEDDIAVMDMLALFRFLLLPQDDMSLAIVLKSPLIGLTEEQLYTLAYNRGVHTLWERLREHEHKKDAFGDAHAWLTRALSRTDTAPPFELISLILNSWDGRRRFVARLGEEVEDPLGELLALALKYESDKAPSLQGFLNWMQSTEVQIKRDMEQGADKVRILTVHGAKGLQAPIVFLPDTTGTPKSDRQPLHWSEDESWLAWAPSSEDEDVICAKLKQIEKARREEESRRLLYVALTRAEDELYVCGYETRGNNENAWYPVVKRGLAPIAQTVTQTLKGDSWEVLRLENPQTAQVKLPETAIVSPSETPDALPAWLTTPPGPEPILPKPLSPSQAAAKESALLSPTLDAQRILRGTLIHTLLQYLPQITPAERAFKIDAFLKARCPDEALCKGIQEELLALLENPLMQPFLGQSGISEAPITGVLYQSSGSPVVVSGQIDRLVVTDNEVWVLDYKTGRHIPQRITDIPASYIRQMQLYRDLLREIYPNKAIRTALLWTAGPKLHEIPDAVLDAKAA